MSRTRFGIISTIGFIAMLSTAGFARGQELKVVPAPLPDYAPNLRPVPVTPRGGLDVDVWTDAGGGAAVHPGEVVNVYFRTTRSAYVAIYDVDTAGRESLLFPRRGESGWVEAGRTVALPGRFAGYELRVTGPAGVERLVALASDQPVVDRRGDYCLSPHGLDAALGMRGPVDGGVVLAPARFDRNAKPNLVRVPVRPQPQPLLARAETWFLVETRWGWR